ncbi:peptidoglycan bridge formation glycyltransferase FemA/FemB family protein [Salisediminibacterium halotolerans]|uniref:Lipid II:glycine glycyltransferase n=1 Tax=Salisediminibacterium halotolerans TaxID=517425 RepID=A0A1H9QJ32_9BACI|nr:peptidoglycan bridge formation glycyltransferase FemA/FemB family protein [Salisediminibacterium haloalkalitolerans]SER60205.1 Acetyltransferase (GNAT) domain-containing protein [Salisediminibacterium haloalkalitolerans]
MNMTSDIYFDPAYGKLYEEAEGGTLETFRFSTMLGTIEHSFIKRAIPEPIQGVTYYDIVTPYGYGGPLVTDIEKDTDVSELIAAFQAAFQRFCIDERIVTEFIRFHPLLGNGELFQTMYDAAYDRDTVGTNLKDYDDPFQAEFSKSARNDVRRALRNGVTYRVTENPKNLDTFKTFYYRTMMKNNATDYYFFSDRYFASCINDFGDHLLLVEAEYDGATIGAGLFFTWGKMIHWHLSGTDKTKLEFAPEYVLTYAITEWGKANGYDIIHHGGGRTNAPDDSLYQFKKKFGKHTRFPFYTAKKIWNPAVYEAICRQTATDSETNFFPPYAKKLIHKTYRRLEEAAAAGRLSEGGPRGGGAS